MSTLNEQLNNPLHGLKLEILLSELVSHYGWDILAEYTRLKCFKNNPSPASSLKFLRKTEWAREALERFYLYKFKNLPEAGEEEFDIPPRQRIIPLNQQPKEPAVLIRGEAPPPMIRANNSDNQNFKKKPARAGENTRSTARKNTEKAPSEKSISQAPSDPWANAPK